MRWVVGLYPISSKMWEDRQLTLPAQQNRRKASGV